MRGHRVQLGVAVLSFLTVIAYLPALRNGFIWDDDDHLTQNPAMTASDGLRQIWSSLSVSRYYPLTLTSFWTQRRLWGLNPLPYHAVNVLIHSANVVLLFVLLRRLNVRAAWTAAALWAVHPINIESVAWITELKNTQSCFFLLAAFLCFLKEEERPKLHWYCASILCFAAALLSKPSTVTFPAILLLYIWWQRGHWRRLDIIRVAPFFALAVAMSALTIAEQLRHVQAEGSGDWSLSGAQRFVVAGRALWFYAGQVFWPNSLAFVYPRWDIQAGSLQAWLPMATSLAAAFALWRFRAQPWARHASFGLGSFALALLPVLGFFDVYYFRFSFVADHFNYLGSAALLAVTTAAVTTFVQQRNLQIGLASGFLLLLFVLTWQRTQVFYSEETLWGDTLKKNPDSFLAHNNLGTIFREKNQPQQAVAHWQEAARISPKAWQPHMNLAKLYLDTEQYDQALAKFRVALRLRPDSVDPRYGLGMTYVKMREYDKARAEFKETLTTKPEEGKVYCWLGEIEEREGHDDEAIQDYVSAIRYDSTLADAFINLGRLRQKRGELDRAINCFETALRLRPDDVKTRETLVALQQLKQRQP